MRPEGMTVYAQPLRLDPRPRACPLRRPGGTGRLSGGSDAFDHAIAEFAEPYADQNDRDYATFQKAAATGQIEAVEGI